jgi:hypothetical protein
MTSRLRILEIISDPNYTDPNYTDPRWETISDPNYAALRGRHCMNSTTPSSASPITSVT